MSRGCAVFDAPNFSLSLCLEGQADEQMALVEVLLGVVFMFFSFDLRNESMLDGLEFFT